MLERYFQSPRVRQRIRENPIAEQIGQFVRFLDGRGHPRGTVQLYVQAVEHFGTWLKTRRRRRTAIDRFTVDEFLQKHLPKCDCPSPASKQVHTTRAALRHLLLSVGATTKELPKSTHLTHEHLVQEFVAHLGSNCGLAPATTLARARYAREFLDRQFPSGKLKLNRLKPRDVTAFVGQLAFRLKRSSTQVAASALRSFFRFLHWRGFCDGSLVRAVPSIPLCGQSSLPKVMLDDQLRRFLKSFDRSTATGRRDYAMAMLMCRLGMRVSEVALLTLDDMDWRNGILHAQSAKGRRERQLPLPHDIGSAIAGYIRFGRPKSSCNYLFLRHSVPVGSAVSRELIRGAIRRAYRRAECPAEWTGTHVLRHTAATRLHEHGASIKEIADLLGHQSINTSAVYTRVNLPMLQSVALPWPKEASHGRH